MRAEWVSCKWTVAYVAIRLLLQTGQLVLRKDTRLRLHPFRLAPIMSRQIAKVETVISRHVTSRPNGTICRMCRTEAHPPSASGIWPTEQITCPAGATNRHRRRQVIVNICTFSVFSLFKMEPISRGWTKRLIWLGSKNQAYPPYSSRPERSRFMGSTSSSAYLAVNYPPCSCSKL
jgi:hypothetical protein